jgi:hypothetical protein
VIAFRWRTIRRALLVICAVIELLVIALPAWFPWLLRPVLRHAGIDYERYERIGYGGFALLGLRGQSGSMRITARRVEVDLPLRWFWRKWRGDASRPFVSATDWRAQLIAQPHPKPSPKAARSTFEALDRAATDFSKLSEWLPVAQLDNGLIISGTNELAVSSLQLVRGELSLRLHSPQFQQNGLVHANLRQFKISLTTEPLGLVADLRARRQPNTWLVEGSAVWATSRIEFVSEFLPTRLRPARLQVRSDNVQISPALLNLKNYADITGTFSADWANDVMEMKLSVTASPTITNLPPMKLQLEVDSASKLTLLASGLGPVDDLSVRGDLRWPEIYIEKLDATLRGQRYKSRGASRVAFGQHSVKVADFRCVSPFGEIFLAGDVQWPGRGVVDARLRDEGSELNLNAQWNESTEVHISGRGHARRVVGLTDATLDAQIDGPATAPTGHIAISVGNVKFEAAREELPIPDLDDLHLNAKIERDSIRALTTMSVEGQPVSASAEMPVNAEFWTGLLTRRRVLDWRRAMAEVHVDDAKLAPFARFMPRVLSPQGTFTIDLALREGRELFGHVQLRDAATRPLSPMGPVRDVNLNVVFDGREFELKEAHATIAGEPLTVTGRGRLPEVGAMEFDLALTGENIPLARQPDFILRSTLALNLTQEHGQATLRGELGLRNSLFLQELKSLMQGRLEQPRSRPPYFSVETQPMADWKLDVHMIGERFLLVRTPLFRGEASLNLHLGGTLREPVALGEMRINSGTVQFPFGNVKIERGAITLSSDNPYRPQLFIYGSAQVLSYNVKMEVTGNADEPQVAFSSTPPLSSEQILLMLTAGEIPRTDITFSTRERANRLAVFFAKNLLTQLGFGEGAAERLTIRPGEQIAEQGGVTYYIEYRLTDRWSATAEYDRFNALNVGLKWRILSK